MNSVWRFTCIILVTILNVSNIQGNHNFFYTQNHNNKIVVTGSNSQLNLNDKPGWTAQAFYNASQNYTGWDILELWSNPLLEDTEQAYHAGYLEGYITRQQIWNYYYNTIEFVLSNKSSTGYKILNDYFTTNTKYAEETVASNLDDPFWYQVDLVYKQLFGILDGYNNATHDQNIPGQILELTPFLSISFLEELSDILRSYELNHDNSTEKNDTHGQSFNDATKESIEETSKTIEPHMVGAHCSGLIKILPGNSDVFIGHDTWTMYTHMSRIMKRYRLAYRVSRDKSSPVIPGMSTAFPSYPASVESVDDFYVINSGLVTMETTNNVYNNSMYKDVHAEGEVLEEIRNVVANRLATNGQTWMDFFKKNNSGTYNNQWMIIDLNKFKPGFDPKKGFLTIIEQAPGLIIGNDQTKHILQYGYWASYNIPFYPEMYERTGNLKVAMNDSSKSYSECPRAKIFRREQPKVTDLNSMIWMMRYNYYKTDPYSVCDKCNPEHNACNAIAARCDLIPINGTYPVGKSPGYFGAIDAKVTSFTLFSKGELVTVGGPTTSGVPPFSWDNSNHIPPVRHQGQPTTWDFPPITTTWILPYTVSTDRDETTDLPTPVIGHNSSPVSQPLSLFTYIFIATYIALRGLPIT